MAVELWVNRQEAELCVDLLEKNYEVAGNDAGIGADFASELREAFGMCDQPELKFPEVYCHGCSKAGGADRAIYHMAPACTESCPDCGQPILNCICMD